MWTALALQDIKLRYRGSLLGPWWLTITTSVMAITISLVYAHIFSMSAGTYLPYVTIGLVVWQLISGLSPRPARRSSGRRPSSSKYRCPSRFTLIEGSAAS
jgi:ABC-type polysaccharide/polyol phosphate export permease